MIDIHHIKEMEAYKSYSGYGYLSHSHRNSITDEKLVDASNSLRFNLYEVFLWCNSAHSRKIMDYNPHSSSDLKISMELTISSLKEEHRRELNHRFAKEASKNKMIIYGFSFDDKEGTPACLVQDEFRKKWVLYYCYVHDIFKFK